MVKKWILSCLLLMAFSSELLSFPKASLRINPNQVSDISDFEVFGSYFSEGMIKGLKDIQQDNKQGFQLLIEEDGIYAFSSCYLDVYRWTGENWENFYQFDNKGYTCGSYPFFHKNMFHLLGGYGFWHNHTDLLHFEMEAGSWSLEKTTQQPKDYSSELAGISDKYAFLLLGIHHNPRLGIENEQEDGGFVLDLETFTWMRLEIGNLISHESKQADYLIQGGLGLDTKRFIVLNGYLSKKQQSGLVIFDKETLEFRFYNWDSPFDFFNFATWIFIEGNRIIFQDDKQQVIDLDLEGFYEKSTFISKAEIVPISMPFTSSKFWILLLIVSALFAGLMGLLFLFVKIYPVKSQFLSRFFLRNQQIEKVDHSSKKEDFDPRWKGLLFHQGRVLTMEEFDRLLKIDSLSSEESKKVRRSRLIKDINRQSEDKLGYTLINRKRNPLDKRYLYYEIHKVD